MDCVKAESLFIVSVIVAEPIWLVAGRRITVRFEPLPPSNICEFGIRPALEEFAVSESDPAADSTSPIVTAIVPLLVFRTNVWSAMAEIDGASLTALTVSVKALLLLDAPSLTVRVMILAPL